MGFYRKMERLIYNSHMVSKAVCTSAQGAINYFENHLNVADYFTESEKVDRGEFIGKVAERVGSR